MLYTKHLKFLGSSDSVSGLIMTNGDRTKSPNETGKVSLKVSPLEGCSFLGPKEIMAEKVLKLPVI